jgi:hypothetical protein
MQTLGLARDGHWRGFPILEEYSKVNGELFVTLNFSSSSFGY